MFSSLSPSLPSSASWEQRPELPPEIAVHTLSYLPLADLQSCCLVSRDVKQLSYQSRPAKLAAYHLNCCNRQNPPSFLLDSHWFSKISYDHLSENEILATLPKISRSIKTLFIICSSSASETFLQDLSSHFAQLQTLRITATAIDQTALKILAENSPGLTSLHLESRQNFNSDLKWASQITPFAFAHLNALKITATTFPLANLLQIAATCPQLQTLSLKQTSLNHQLLQNEEEWRVFSNLSFSKLSSLKLSHLNLTHLDSLATLSQSLPQLENFALKNSTLMGRVLQKSPFLNLTKLKFIKCTLRLIDWFNFNHTFPILNHLQIRDSSILFSQIHRPLPVNEPLLPHLAHLNLKNCDYRYIAIFLEMLSQNNSALRTLKLGGSLQFNNTLTEHSQALIHLDARAFPHVTKLDIQGCSLYHAQFLKLHASFPNLSPKSYETLKKLFEEYQPLIN